MLGFSPLGTRPLATSAKPAGSTGALAGSASMTVGASGAPSLSASVAGAAAAVISATGMMTLSAGLAGSAVLTGEASGGPGIGTGLAGAAATTLSATGAPARAASISGQGAMLVAAAGQPQLSSPIAGAPAGLLLSASGRFERFTAAASYSGDDYLAAAQALMPRGPAWPRDPDAMQTAVLRALVQSAERLDGDANELLINLFPGTTFAFLNEWESTVGLPDAIAGPAPTTAKRQRAIAARLAGAQSFSRNAIRTFCGVLGYDAFLSSVTPFRVNQATVGQALADNQWANTVAIRLTPSQAPPFTDALGAWDLAFCIQGLRRMAPAHLALIFQT